jgi:hypothetical protein
MAGTDSVLRIGDEVSLADGTWCVVVGVSDTGEALLQDGAGHLLVTVDEPDGGAS